MMKKAILIIAVLALLPVFACAQTVETGPVTISWGGEESNHQVAIQQGTEEIIILDETDILEHYIDLQSLGHYGAFVVLVRSLIEVDGTPYYSDWLRSDIEGDVIMIDGEAQLFMLVSIAKPTGLRIKQE